MNIKGNNKCYLCDSNIQWWAWIHDGRDITGFELEGEAQITLVGKENKKIQYEVVARCSNCNNNNKFIVEK